ncbi:MAG: TonB-dependent receptor plug domain-containing protein, partial [Pseudomonadales bacterium]
MIIKRTKLAAAVSAVCTLMATQAHAQDTQLEEVVITGIRGSLTQALDIKRNSAGVMDAISAEDIGKFPDTNLAESLQRITGVSVNRVEGEGSEVTIRGFSGDFNLVTLNGRQMPAADNNVAFFGMNANQAKGDSRSFDFSNIASEGVSGLQVYKTGRASAPSGGLGGTINIQTIRPLEAGNQMSFGAKAVDDAGGDGITPEFSGLASWVNDAGTLGVT